MSIKRRKPDICPYRKSITNVVCMLIPFIIYATPALVCYLVISISTPSFQVTSYILSPLIYAAGFPFVAALISSPFQDGIVSGRFPRNSGHRTYSKRKIYGTCWTTLYYNKPLYFLVLNCPYLKYSIFRMFGYKSDLNFISYPDSWIRDLSLLEFGKNVYLSNRAVLGTNMCHVRNSIYVDRICIGENSVVGKLAMIAHGTEIGANSEIGAGARIGAKVKIGNYVDVGPSCTVNHYAVLGNNVTIGAGSYIGAGARVTDNVTIPPGAIIPDRAIWKNILDTSQFISTTYLFNHNEIIISDQKRYGKSKNDRFLKFSV